MQGIYSITHRPTGLRYIGSALRIAGRWRQHRHELLRGRHHSDRLQKAWNKHGAEAFVFEVVEAVSDKERLLEREQHWIDTLRTVSPGGFNMRPRAESNLGKVFCDTARLNMSEAAKRRPPDSAEVRAKRSAYMKGRVTPEWREKMAAGNRGKKRSAEGRANMSAAGKARVARARGLEVAP